MPGLEGVPPSFKAGDTITITITITARASKNSASVCYTEESKITDKKGNVKHGLPNSYSGRM